jgi:N-acetylglucosamine-6-sulfatase
MPLPLSRRHILAAAAGPFVHTARAQARRRPNFLFLLTDDQSYATLSLTGNPFMKTPHIDRIGREGVLFTNGFVAMSLCAPSRACFLSGLYPHRNGIINNNLRWNQETPTLPLALQGAGYRTGYIGKFHMDNDDRVQPGFDYWASQINQGQYVNPRKNINGTWTDLQGYDTTIITDQALQFIRDSVKQGKPFCTWMGYKACHGPFTPAPGHENDFSNVEFKPPQSFFLDDESKPDRVRRKSQYLAMTRPAARKAAKKKQAGDPPASLEAWAARERDQYRSLMGVEDSAARLFAVLEETGTLDDTIIFYSGDNGFFHGEHGLHGKMEAYEESIRVPMMVRYPRAIKANQRIDSYVVNVDLAPAILDFCGVAQPKPMQGRSWRPLVTGAKPARPWRDHFVYTMHNTDAAAPTVKSIRTDRYKLILSIQPKDKAELYDLRTDPQEMRNLAADPAHKDLLTDLKRRLLATMKELEDPAIPAVEAAL